MATIVNIEISEELKELTRFIIDTRLRCLAYDCAHNTVQSGEGEFDCSLKQVEIKKGGKCAMYQEGEIS